MASRKSDQSTLRDVAKAANVSMMTVSRALRGIEGVSEAKRISIQKTAKRLNYVLNSNARSLVSTNSDIIGISLPTLYNDVFAGVLDGMRHTFEHAGFATVLDTTKYNQKVEQDWVERILTWRPAGMVLTGTDHSPKLRAALEQSNVPTLEIWDVTDSPIDICVGINHRQAGLMAGNYARKLGYRNPAFVGEPRGLDKRADKRLLGFREAFDVPVQAERIRNENAYVAGFTGMSQHLNRNPRPDIVFFLNDHFALGGMMACRAAGLDCPRDVGLFGFNALDVTAVLPVQLSTVKTPRRLIGITGARNLLARIDGILPERTVSLPVELIEGETTRLQ